MRLSFVAIMLIMIVVASAGCSSKPEVGSSVTSSSVFSEDYNWVEYNSVNTGETVRIEKFNDNYQGVPAVLQKITVKASYASVVADYYYDIKMEKILGGTITSTLNGQTMTEDIDPTDESDVADTFFGPNVILTYQGTQSVSVPAGTYSDADLYTNVSTTSGTSSYYMSSDIPVPVKMTQGELELELTGWG